MRLAVFTPLPPDRSGIAAYSAELLPRLAAGHEIEVFLDRPVAEGETLGGALAVPLFQAFDFQPRQARAPFDLIVYQLGNARCHDYMWAYLTRYPGLVVLHDAQLHHARAAALMARGREADYRAEFAFSHPQAPADIAEFVVNGLQGSPYFLWPLRRVAIVAARAVAVHDERLAGMLRAEVPASTPIVTVAMGTRPHAAAGAVFVDGSPVFAALGGVTAEKRVPEILRAFARVREVAPHAALLLIGDRKPHYDVGAEARALGLESRVRVAGYVPDEDLDAWIAAADVCLCLRWPTSRETSASWLRCLAAGKPTVITDLAHTVDVPSLDPRTWELQHASSSAAQVNRPPRRESAVCVAIDILDEEHSLGLAMRRLAADAELRGTLGRNAREWWASHHTLDQMVDDYERALVAARDAPSTPAEFDTLPPHLRDEGRATLGRIFSELGVTPPL